MLRQYRPDLETIAACAEAFGASPEEVELQTGRTLAEALIGNSNGNGASTSGNGHQKRKTRKSGHVGRPRPRRIVTTCH